MPIAPKSHSQLLREKRESARAEEVDKGRPSASKRGYDRRHADWRKMVLHRDPVCKICNSAPSTVADHIIPLARGGENTLENGQGLCASCHGKKTQAEDAARPIPTTIVCGPPGSGRKEYVNLHKRYGDLVVDIDTLYIALGAGEKPKQLLQFAMAAREGVYKRILQPWKNTTKPGRAWVIVGSPEAQKRAELQQRLLADVIVLETSANDCEYRLRQDKEQNEAQIKATMELVKRWWSRYRTRDGEKVI